MKATPTRTLNPLPFGDLEPHRFEDLIRQLAYDLRRWKSLEATGRGGTDSGMDIRAIELVPVDHEPAEAEDEKNETSEENFFERQWIFQCKRERSLPPKRIRKVTKESLRSFEIPPYGFVLAAACDISKLARDAFREEMVSRGIEEFFIWSKSELEDLLFQPKNDRLLFAYFGIALQPKRRGLSTALRSEITKKKQLTALLSEEDERRGKLILLRDPTDERYPHEPKPHEPPARWSLCRGLTLRKPGHLIVLQHEYLATTSDDGKQWDAILGLDTMLHMAEGELRSSHAWGLDDKIDPDRSAYEFWNEYIDESSRAYLKIRRAVPLNRILALDPLGDGHFPVPHILVEFVDKTGPFTTEHYPTLERVGLMGGHIDMDVSTENRARIFPVPLPAGNAPEPPGFDDTGRGAPLTSDADTKLDELLRRMDTRRKNSMSESIATAPSSQDEKVKNNKMSEFQRWRENIALPVFSSFVLRLQAAGHRARVVVRSVAASDAKYREAFEAVDLRMRFQFANYFNPSGHMHISFSEHLMSWQTNVSPPTKDERGRYGSANNGPNMDSAITKEQLEALVLEIIERMEGEFR